MKNIIGVLLVSVGFRLAGWGMNLITDKKLQDRMIDGFKEAGLRF